jgi:hypothetical protein
MCSSPSRAYLHQKPISVSCALPEFPTSAMPEVLMRRIANNSPQQEKVETFAFLSETPIVKSTHDWSYYKLSASMTCDRPSSSNGPYLYQRSPPTKDPYQVGFCKPANASKQPPQLKHLLVIPLSLWTGSWSRKSFCGAYRQTRKESS